MVLKDLRYRLEYGLVLGASAWLQKGRLETAQALGRGLGRAAFGLGVARSATLENLEKHLGGLTLAERKRIELWTGDQRLYNALHQAFPFIRWLGDYQR